MLDIDESALSTLATTLGGNVLTASDDGFAAARAAAIWNGDIDRQPAVIARPGTDAEVAAVLEFTRQTSLDLSVRGGGHNFAGHAVCDDGVMLDLGRINTVAVDPATRRARCGGGATWAQLDAATAEHGLAVTGGFISHTGVAGLTLGGGMGWLSRRAGLSCDSLVSARVVTADGRTVTASAQENPDLWWALRGGGGNFGVVTEFEFALIDLAPMANLGLFFWTPEHAREPLRFARDFIPALPEAYGAFIAGLSAPPAPFVPEQYQGQPGFAVLVVNWGLADEHAATVAPLREQGPQFELITPIPYLALQQMFDDSAPWGIHGYEKALYFDQLSNPVIDTLIEALPRKASPMTFIPTFALGGAYARVGEDDTAFGGPRGTQWTVNLAAIAPTPDLLAADKAWVREVWDRLLPHAAGSGSYVNFIADDDPDRVIASYGQAKYARLAEIKAEWDPDNVFHHNANIRPAVAEPIGM
jgi:FAD/FMN-containing dehydrogenase